MRVAIRCDASAVMGLGHLQRCLALAHALTTSGAQPIFVTRALGLDSAERVARAGLAVLAMRAPGAASVHETVPAHAGWAGVNWQDDAIEFVDMLERVGSVDWVVIDHYAFDARWHKAVAKRLGARVAVIDDLADRPLACDVVIDHNFCTDHSRKYEGCIQPGTAILGGPKFALLGPTYAAAPRHHCRERLESIGIFMGGIDAGGYSSVAYTACREGAGFKGPIEIASSHGNPGLARLRDLANGDPLTQITIDAPELSAFFARHDLQIGAGGGATWERCCIGAPTVATVVAENQRAVLEPLATLGVLRVAEPTAVGIARQVSGLAADPAARCDMARRAAALVDGRGAERVCRHMVAA